MAPEKRVSKKPDKFDPHPPGSKHKMMSERSRTTKGKKDVKEKLKIFRQDAAKNAAKNAEDKKGSKKKNIKEDSASRGSGSKQVAKKSQAQKK